MHCRKYINALFALIYINTRCLKPGLHHSIANAGKFTQQCNVVPYFYAVYWLRPPVDCMARIMVINLDLGRGRQFVVNVVRQLEIVARRYMYLEF